MFLIKYMNNSWGKPVIDKRKWVSTQTQQKKLLAQL